MSENVTLVHKSGKQQDVTVKNKGQVACPNCDSENIDFHNLNRVLAGECGSCFTTWTIGVDNDWEVEDGDRDE